MKKRAIKLSIIRNPPFIYDPKISDFLIFSGCFYPINIPIYTEIVWATPVLSLNKSVLKLDNAIWAVSYVSVRVPATMVTKWKDIASRATQAYTGVKN